MWYNEHSISVLHCDIQEVRGSSRIVTALVLKFAGVHWGAAALFKYLSVAAFADILGEAAWSHT